MPIADALGKGNRRVRPWVLVVAAVAVIATVVLVTNGGGKPSPGGHGSTHSHGGKSGSTHDPDKPLDLTATVPASGASDVPSDTDISLTFSAPVKLGSVRPTLSPAVAGSWVQSSKTTINYELQAPLIPSTNETITVPGGTSGLRGAGGGELAATDTIAFTVAVGDYTRLQQLLAQLNYLPLSFTPSSPSPPAPKEMASPQPGTFAWRWPDQPTALMSIWVQGTFDEITRAAVESFENQNNMTVDGIAGPEVWTTLLADVASDKVDTNPYVYVLVNKVQPENLTLYDNGAVDLSDILVNTGASGADTVDGNYAVFEHVRYSDMKGTNPDGTKYNDPNVPYASYFNGGDALHGFIRAAYGYPQSNGCVEMSYANAALVWPLTPIGTLVTIEGPATPGPPPTTTTTTTTPPPPPPTTTTTHPATPPT
jgi:peptidoglycan hydrolase-like protein with peptidoglycan-binding domain